MFDLQVPPTVNFARNTLVGQIAYRARILADLPINDLRQVALQYRNEIHKGYTRPQIIEDVLNSEFQK